MGGGLLRLVSRIRHYTLSGGRWALVQVGDWDFSGVLVGVPCEAESRSVLVCSVVLRPSCFIVD